MPLEAQSEVYNRQSRLVVVFYGGLPALGHLAPQAPRGTLGLLRPAEKPCTPSTQTISIHQQRRENSLIQHLHIALRWCKSLLHSPLQCLQQIATRRPPPLGSRRLCCLPQDNKHCIRIGHVAQEFLRARRADESVKNPLPSSSRRISNPHATHATLFPRRERTWIDA